MLRFRDIRDANAAGSYYGKSDGGYYLDSSDLRREVGGKGAEALGLTGSPDFDQFKRLLEGLDPRTGEQLTAKLLDNRLVGWDITATIPKGVTIAIEHGDERVHDALWQAGREAMADIEALVTTRMRGGRDTDKITGNMIWYGFEHPETRPLSQDGMPDPDRHIHFVIPNVTYDADEGQWKAIRFRPIMDLRKYFDRRFDMRLASKLTDLGYEIETKRKADPKGGMRFYSWDIKDMPKSVVEKYSRRAAEVEKLTETLGVRSAVGKDKLGATSRLHKRDDMTLEDYRAYWNGRLTDDERRGIAATIKAAMLGKNPEPVNRVADAVAFAVSHEFERNSVVDWHKVAITAMERSMGAGHPDQVMPEAMRQGLLVKGDDSTTRVVLEQESRIIAFAREGRGTVRPLGAEKSRAVETERLSSTPTGAGEEIQAATLSPEQQAVCEHIWKSPDRVIVIEGDAGTGKTTTMERTIPGIDRPGVFLAPSASASRGELRNRGFTNADTVARFLVDDNFRAKARDGFIYIDEAPLASLNDIDRVFAYAKQLNARVILKGDRKQHQSVQRGNLFPLMEKFAGLPVGRLTENRRQQHEKYREAVNAIAAGDIVGGHDKLAKLGWVVQSPAEDGNKQLVDEYMATRAAGKSVLVVSPTHQEADEVTDAIRQRLKQEGEIKDNEKTFPQLVPLHWSEAQKADAGQYDGTEIIQFHRNSGAFRAGQRVQSDAATVGGNPLNGNYFSVYRPGEIGIADGDIIRFTGNGWSLPDANGNKHRLDNGAEYQVEGFSEPSKDRPDGGDIVLSNGWTIAKEFGHLTHAYTTTSHASQGKTVDVVLGAMSGDSVPAMNAEQFYVTASRGREAFKLFTDLQPDALREAILKNEKRTAAVEVFGAPVPEKPCKQSRLRKFLRRMQQTYRQLREKTFGGTDIGTRQQEYAYGR